MTTEDAFWQKAMSGLPRFRWLRRPTPVAELDALFNGRLRAEWEALKMRIEPGDQIWPFELNVRSYLGLRKGYLVLRRGKPIGGIVHIVS